MQLLISNIKKSGRLFKALPMEKVKAVDRKEPVTAGLFNFFVRQFLQSLSALQHCPEMLFFTKKVDDRR